jgi:voltage-gated potassium channel Kch
VPHEVALITEKRLTGHVLLVGYGRLGQRIGEALFARGVPFVVAEQNPMGEHELALGMSRHVLDRYPDFAD